LNPTPTGDSPYRPIIVSDRELADVELSGFDCVFLCNVSQINANDVQRLRQYGQAGGGIVCFLGDRVDRDSYNALASGEEPLLPATLGEVVAHPEIGVDPLDYRHPIVAPFRGRERAGLLTTPIWQYHRLTLSNDLPDVQVAAAMRNGDPLIVTAHIGLGRTVLVATDGALSSVDAESGDPWTNWPTWPSFLPVVRELLAYALSGKQQEWQHPVGTPLASRLVPAPVEATSRATSLPTLKIERPDGLTATLTVQSTPSSPEWNYADTSHSGIYTLRGLPNNKTRSYAINVDPRESDVQQIDPQQLPAELHSLDADRDSEHVGDAIGVSRAGWNDSLLWTAFVLILLESFLAWQFGRGAL
jgi:hypothetical protein